MNTYRLICANIARERNVELRMLADVAMLLDENIHCHEAIEKARGVMIRKYGDNWYTGEPPKWKEKHNDKD